MHGRSRRLSLRSSEVFCPEGAYDLEGFDLRLCVIRERMREGERRGLEELGHRVDVVDLQPEGYPVRFETAGIPEDLDDIEDLILWRHVLEPI